MRCFLFAVYCKWKREPQISDMDAMPARECRSLLDFSGVQIRGARKKQPGWLSQWIAGWVFLF
jgi:hypothetical protein